MIDYVVFCYRSYRRRTKVVWNSKLSSNFCIFFLRSHSQRMQIPIEIHLIIIYLSFIQRKLLQLLVHRQDCASNVHHFTLKLLPNIQQLNKYLSLKFLKQAYTIVSYINNDDKHYQYKSQNIIGFQSLTYEVNLLFYLPSNYSQKYSRQLCLASTIPYGILRSKLQNERQSVSCVQPKSK